METLDIIVICLAVSALALSVVSVALNIVFFRMQINLARTMMKDSTSLAEETKTLLNEIRISQDITGQQVKDQYDKLLDAAIQSKQTSVSIASSAKVSQEVNESLDSLERRVTAGSSPEQLKKELDELKVSFRNLNQSIKNIVSSATRVPRERTGTSRFEKFSENARRALTLAQEEALRLKTKSIDVGHLLLGILRENKFRAYKIINSLDADISKIIEATEYLIPQEEVIKEEVGLTSRAKHVIELTISSADNLNSNRIGTEHLLLGILEEEGPVAALLNEYGITIEKVKEMIPIL